MHRLTRLLFASGLATMALCSPLTVSADQLVMKNGDVITGTVTKVADGKVYIDPSYSLNSR